MLVDEHTQPTASAQLQSCFEKASQRGTSRECCVEYSCRAVWQTRMLVGRRSNSIFLARCLHVTFKTRTCATYFTRPVQLDWKREQHTIPFRTKTVGSLGDASVFHQASGRIDGDGASYHYSSIEGTCFRPCIRCC